MYEADDPQDSILAKYAGSTSEDPQDAILNKYDPPKVSLEKKDGFWSALVRKGKEIGATGAQALSDLRNDRPNALTDLSVNALEALGKPAKMFGATMVSGLTNAGNKLGLVSDATNEGIQEDMYNRITGGTWTSDDQRAQEFAESQRTAAGKAGAVAGDLGLMALAAPAVGALGAAGGGTLPARIALRAGQGLALGAPSTYEQALSPDSSVTGLGKKLAADATMGALFSSRVNKALEMGKTPAQVFTSRMAVKAPAIGAAQAGVSAALGDEGTFASRFGEALPGSVATMLAMEAPAAIGGARARSHELRALEEYAAREEAARPQREIEDLTQKYAAAKATVEDLTAKSNMAIGTEIDPGLAKLAQRETAAKLAAQQQRARASLEAELSSARDNVDFLGRELLKRGIAPEGEIAPGDLAPERTLQGDPEGARIAAEELAAWEASQGLPTGDGRPPVRMGPNQPIDLSPQRAVPADPYASPQPVPARLGPNQPVDLSPQRPTPNDPYGPSPRSGESLDGIQELYSGLDVRKVLQDWWQGKGEEKTVKLPNGKEVAYKVGKDGKIEFYTDSKGNYVESKALGGHQYWKNLDPRQREEVFRIMERGGESNDPVVNDILARATQRGMLTPDVEELGPVKAFRESFEGTWMPGSSSEAAGPFRNAARQFIAERVFEQARMSRAFQAHKDLFDNPKLGDVEKLDRFKRVMDYMEGRQDAKLSPEEKAAADELRPELEKRAKELVDLGILQDGQELSDYFGRAWQKGVGAGSLMRDSNIPLEGKKSFAKAQVYDTGTEAMVEGAELPETSNPVEMQLWKMRQMDKAILGRKLMEEGIRQGSVKMADDPDIPENWVKVSGVGNEYVMEPGVAKVVKNMVGKGLRGGRAYDTLATINNILNQAQLGASGFHGGFVTMDSMISRVSQAAQKMKTAVKQNDGDLALEAMKDTGLSLTVVGPAIDNFIKGRQILKDVQAGKVDELTKMALEGGMHYEMDPMYKTGRIEKFKQNIRDAKLAKDQGATGNLIKATAKAIGNSPLAGLELGFKPIGEIFVPAVKAAAVHDLAKLELKRLGADASIDARREAMRKVVDSIDNRMGQLAYDNLFWNRTAKDLMHLAQRSVGWNLGTVREIGGGAADLAKVPFGGELSHRATYALALPVMTAYTSMLYQAVMTFLKTGKAEMPVDEKSGGADWKTLLGMPKTGEITLRGETERDQMAGYMGDVVKYGRNPTATVLHKIGPLLNSGYQFASNKDFYGNQIRDKSADADIQAKYAAQWALGQVTPFSFRNIGRIKQEHGMDMSRFVATMLGVNPAPAWVNRTDAENKMSEYVGAESPVGGRTYAEQGRREGIKELRAVVNRANAGDPEALRKLDEMSRTRDLAKELSFVGKQSDAVRAKRNKDLFNRRLSLSQAWDVYDSGTPEEKAEWAPMLRMKAAREAARSPILRDDSTNRALEHIKKALGVQ